MPFRRDTFTFKEFLVPHVLLIPVTVLSWLKDFVKYFNEEINGITKITIIKQKPFQKL